MASRTFHTYFDVSGKGLLCVNNIEVTVNTCTCTAVFTVITTKDQSGGIYNRAQVARDSWLQ